MSRLVRGCGNSGTDGRDARMRGRPVRGDLGIGRDQLDEDQRRAPPLKAAGRMAASILRRFGGREAGRPPGVHQCLGEQEGTVGPPPVHPEMRGCDEGPGSASEGGQALPLGARGNPDVLMSWEARGAAQQQASRAPGGGTAYPASPASVRLASPTVSPFLLHTGSPGQGGGRYYFSS